MNHVQSDFTQTFLRRLAALLVNQDSQLVLLRRIALIVRVEQVVVWDQAVSHVQLESTALKVARSV